MRIYVSAVGFPYEGASVAGVYSSIKEAEEAWNKGKESDARRIGGEYMELIEVVIEDGKPAFGKTWMYKADGTHMELGGE